MSYFPYWIGEIHADIGVSVGAEPAMAETARCTGTAIRCIQEPGRPAFA